VKTRTTRNVAATVLAAVLGALVLLSGCTPTASLPRDIVATVDGRVVLTTEQLAQIRTPLLQLIGTDQDTSAVISVVIMGEIAPSIATANQIELTADQQAQVTSEAASVTDPVARGVVEKFYAAYLIYQVLSQKDASLWIKGLSQAQVEVQPRYGSWYVRDDTYGIEGGTVDSLSQPSAAPSTQATGG